jgi:hypothetical protein
MDSKYRVKEEQPSATSARSFLDRIAAQIDERGLLMRSRAYQDFFAWQTGRDYRK